MEKWVVMAKKADFQRIGEQFGIDPVIARIIRNRDVVEDVEIEEYLNGGIYSLPEPTLMKDIEKAADILVSKIKEDKKIRVIGDYDIDGIQSSYILWAALRRSGANADIAIPNRISDGYGLNERLLIEAKEAGVDTVLTCDNGIAAYNEIQTGKELGMTILVTDHHEVPYEEVDGRRCYRIPPADAIVNPKQAECEYPFKGLCGAGVAYKLIQVLYRKMGKTEGEEQEFLPYVAFATVGDVMELQGENRILVKEGLKRLPQLENKGLRALILQNQLLTQEVRAYHIGFVLGPCLNASGRLDTAIRAIQLLQSEDEGKAAELAKDLYDLNESRKELTGQGVECAEILARQAKERGDKVFVLFLPECHESLAGIIAGRIREKYNHPVFVLTRGEEGVKGSGRSIESYSMYEELCKIKDVFTKFGGHPMAAGVSLDEDKVDEMRIRLNQAAILAEEDFVEKVKIDVPMPLDYITMELIEELKVLEPFGKGNEKPVFADKGIQILSMRMFGKENRVCRMKIKTASGNVMDAVYFGDTEKFKNDMEKQLTASFVYYPEVNEYNGQKSIQIVVKKYA